MEHIAEQICWAVLEYGEAEELGPIRLENTMLVSGGGLLNTFVMHTIQKMFKDKKVHVTVVPAELEMAISKEALIFAFLGLRCLLSLTNVLQEVTGADRDSVCGSIHLPPGGVPVSLLSTDQYSFSFKRRRSSTAGSLSVPGPNGNMPSLSEEAAKPPTLHASWPEHLNVNLR